MQESNAILQKIQENPQRQKLVYVQENEEQNQQEPSLINKGKENLNNIVNNVKEGMATLRDKVEVGEKMGRAFSYSS